MALENRGLSKRYKKFVKDVLVHTPFVRVTILLVFLWFFFAAVLYLAETGSATTTITSYGKSLYWGIAAFSTAGIADMPTTGLGELVGGIWIIIGSMLFFWCDCINNHGLLYEAYESPGKTDHRND